MLRKLLHNIFLVSLPFGLFAQTNPTAQSLPYSQNFGTTTFTSMPAGMAAWNGINGGSVSTQALAEASSATGNATLTAATAATTSGGTFGYAVSSNARPYIQTSSNSTNGANQIAVAINTSGRTSITVGYDVEIISAQPRTIGVVMQYRVGTSGSWTTVTGTGNPYSQAGGTAGVKASPSIVLPADANNQSVVQIRWAIWRGTETGNSSGLAIDNISITGTASSSPTIITSTSSLTGFSAVTGNNSTSQNFTVRATNVTERVVLTAPTGYQLSRNNTTFQDTVHTSFVVDSVPTQTIHVRQTSSTLGTTSGNIACTSAGATTVNVSVSGVVLSTEPTTQPTLTLGTITTSSIELTVGNTAGLTNWIVVAREGSAVDGIPVDGTDYTANATFSSGAIINTNNRVVLKGNGTSVTVTVPNPATVYHFAVYAYNDGGVATSTNYNTTSPGTANATTLAVPLGWQINATNSLFTINFDATVANVNNGVFTATTTFGASNPSAGQLNSNAWAYNANAGGAATFGGSLTSGFGASTGGVTSSGVFAFEVSSGNVALGIQPTGTVFQAGGHLTLRIQNKTGATLNNVQLSYTLWVNNNEARSTTIGFSRSTDNSTYTAVSDASFNSTEASQGSVLWVPHYYSVTLSSLNIAADGFLYLRWTGTDNGGSGSRDEFAIDDINFIAERTSTNLTTSGNFANMLIDGNVSVSSASTVTGILNLKSGVLGSSGNLTLKSTSTGTATVVGGTNSSISGNVTVERFLPWQSANNNGFRFVGHSFSAAPVINTVTGLPTASNTLIGYSETGTGAYVEIANRAGTWPLATSYGVWTNSTNTLSMSGALQLSDLNSVSFANNGTGWNLAANPFYSVLDWDAVTRSNVQNANWIWVKDNVTQGSGTWGSYIDGVSANGGSRYLAPAQGFMIKANGTSPNVSFPAAARVTGQTPTFQRTALIGEMVRVRVKRPTNSSSMETVIRFRGGATNGFDNDYDAQFMSDWVAATPDIFTKDLNNVSYSINAMPELNGQSQTIPLQLALEADMYTLVIDRTDVNPSTTVTIEDTKTGNFYEMLSTQDSVNFNYSAADLADRFKVHFNRSTVSTGNTSSDDNIKIGTDGSKIALYGAPDASVKILDVAGKVLRQYSQLDTNQGAIETGLPTGVYLIQISSGKKIKNIKFIIR